MEIGGRRKFPDRRQPQVNGLLHVLRMAAARCHALEGLLRLDRRVRERQRPRRRIVRLEPLQPGARRCIALRGGHPLHEGVIGVRRGEVGQRGLASAAGSAPASDFDVVAAMIARIGADASASTRVHASLLASIASSKSRE
jgi:hypothetical protein